MDRMVPIHLLAEGYKNINVAFKNPPEGLTATANIDDSKDIVDSKRYIRDWIVRIKLEAKCKDAIDESIDTKFAVFATGTLKGGKEVSDVVARGILEILPGPYVK